MDDRICSDSHYNTTNNRRTKKDTFAKKIQSLSTHPHFADEKTGEGS